MTAALAVLPTLTGTVRENFPRELLERAQWLLWRLETRASGPTKVPYNAANGYAASTTNVKHWTSFDVACKRFAKGGFDGIGFVFSADDPYTGVDLDACRNPETGELAPWALEIIARLNGYAELSPTGTGVHIYVRATLPGDGLNRLLEGHKVEMYDRGRYFTVTGRRL
jgi:putative DNA primase/helicase